MSILDEKASASVDFRAASASRDDVHQAPPEYSEGIPQQSQPVQDTPSWLVGLEKVVMMAAEPLSRAATSLGCESFVPLPLDKECLKAADILRTFSSRICRTQTSSVTSPLLTTALVTPPEPTAEGKTASPAQHIVTIPPSAIAGAVGLAVLTTGRVGLGSISGSTGSGILISRDPNTGKWGKPTGIKAHSFGAGPLAMGVDVTDRVYVIYTREALSMFTRAHVVLGPEVTVAAGPYGGGGGVRFAGSFPISKAKSWRARREQMRREKWERWHKKRRELGIQWGAGRGHGHGCGGRGGRWAAVADNDDAKAADEKAALLHAENAPAQDAAAKDAPAAAGAAAPAAAAAATGRDENIAIRDSLQNPVYCYMRSAGLYAGFQAEGTIVVERAENSAPVSSLADLTESTQELLEALRFAEFGVENRQEEDPELVKV